MPSMMRALAWCGTNAAMSSGATPARSQACSASGASAVVAQRNTAWPSCWMYGRQPSIRTASLFSGTEPQTTGPMPARLAVGGGGDHRGAGAVAEDDAGRAVGPVGEVGQLLGADDDRVARRAGADGVVDGAQRVGEAGAGGVEVVRARGGDAELGGDPAGARWGCGRPRCRWPRPPGRCRPAVRPELASAFSAAAVGHVGDRLGVGDPPASTMPTRSRIHSSLVSTIWARSSLVTHPRRLVVPEGDDAAAGHALTSLRSVWQDRAVLSWLTGGFLRCGRAVGRGRPGRRGGRATR